MHGLKARIDRLLGAVIALAFAVLVACVVWQVVSRYILGTPSTVTDEMARFLFMWVGLIGAAYTLGQRRHLAIDVLPLMVSGTTARMLSAATLVLIAGFGAVVMVYGGGQLVLKTLATGQVSPALRLPMGYIYGAIPFSGAMILYYCLHDIALLARGEDPNADPDAPAPAGARQD
ncbi:TRAP transporter small permease [Polymorphum gilvum]|uniref:TRAP transporter small permease protein n=1 Tax=Polymorphum gilvum (strain LMG 25793 / CGMCC 1.9160 / SL003B-26A1) TaxID=991905 RepID=F2IXJ9_POLGS|nr:TRAP transporter small permease [Polymorphum gilvum]ADZ71622.1 Trap-type c4-dicarboxylate transport system, small permease component [Polymorphum gilvum SL003B-26A1]